MQQTGQPSFFEQEGPGAPGLRPAAPAAAAGVPLSALAAQLEAAVAGAFPAPVWVIAEIAELRVDARGHCYLTLVEKGDGGVVAKLSATCWTAVYKKLSAEFVAATGTPPAAGMKVLVQAQPVFSRLYGMSLQVKGIDPAFTLGDLARRRKEIIDRLGSEGLLDRNRAIPLPLVPQRVAVISSAGAAGWGDFSDQLAKNRQGYFFKITFFESPVQGEALAPGVIAALRTIYLRHDEFDAICIVRGGGSQTDLMWFDNYDVARAIALSRLPVLVGIGHERDETVPDLVASVSCKTPTALAEYLIGRFQAVDSACAELAARCSDRARVLMAMEHARLTGLSGRCAAGASRRIQQQRQLLEQLPARVVKGQADALTREGRRLEAAMRQIAGAAGATVSRRSAELLSLLKILAHGTAAVTARQQTALEVVSGRLRVASLARLAREQDRLVADERRVRLLDPINTLARGYSIVRHNGSAADAAGVEPGDLLDITTYTGSIAATVTSKEEVHGNTRTQL